MYALDVVLCTNADVVIRGRKSSHAAQSAKMLKECFGRGGSSISLTGKSFMTGK